MGASMRFLFGWLPEDVGSLLYCEFCKLKTEMMSGPRVGRQAARMEQQDSTLVQRETRATP